MIVHDCEQKSPEWYAVRRGMPTASQFQTVIGKGRDGGTSLTRKTYLLKLAGEIITEQPMENYSNEHMERGRIMEAEARDFYMFATNSAPELVGFMTDDIRSMGASPDALIRKDGMLEIKTALPHILIPLLLAGRFPPEHQAQVQGGLLVAEREWCDLIVYWPNMPLFKARAYRDEPYIKKLISEIERFNEELIGVVEAVKRYGT